MTDPEWLLQEFGCMNDAALGRTPSDNYNYKLFCEGRMRRCNAIAARHARMEEALRLIEDECGCECYIIARRALEEEKT